ncbi:MAG: DPP IV N-terminal domain-containing protein, partial [Psychrosphaera sp.]|nr:DPP IV N-terminal domain-containing protein [Psychrosphaera sp.]
MLKQRLRRTLQLGAASVLALSAMTASMVASADVLTVEKVNTLNTLHDVKVSPDGSRLIYGLKEPGEDNKTKSNNLYVLSLVGKNVRPEQVTNNKHGEYSVQWNAKGDAVYFLTSRSGSSQVWRISLRGGEAKQITDLPLDVDGFKLSPDNNSLVFRVAGLHRC